MPPHHPEARPPYDISKHLQPHSWFRSRMPGTHQGLALALPRLPGQQAPAPRGRAQRQGGQPLDEGVGVKGLLLPVHVIVIKGGPINALALVHVGVILIHAVAVLPAHV